MLSKVKRIFSIIIISLLIICINGCSYDNNKNQKLKVRVGYFPNITHLQAVVGLSDGSFAKSLGENIEIDKKVFNAGPAEIEAFMAGQLDIGYIGPVPAINCFSKTDGMIKIIGGSCDNGALFLANTGSGIKSINELSGKKIAVPQFGNTQDILLRRILKQNNFETVDKGGTITIVQSENSNILTLLDRGHIDAALVPEPWGTMIAKRTDVNILLESRELLNGSNYSTTVIIARKKFMDEHPDVVEKWIHTHKEITEKANNKKQQYVEKFIHEIKSITGQSLNNEEINCAIENVDLSSEPSAESIQSYIDYLYETKVIEKKILLKDIIDSKYIE